MESTRKSLITGLYTVNCYIRKQILYFARERFLQQIANLLRWKPSRLLKQLTIVTQINTMQNTLLTLMNGA